MALTIGVNYGFCAASPADDPAATNASIDNVAYVVRDTSPAGTNVITEVGWWCDNATEEANFEVGLYASDGEGVPGEAGTLLYSEKTNAKGLDAGWKKRTGLNWAINPSTVYWIAVQLDNTDTTTNGNYTSSGGSGLDYIVGAATLPSQFEGGAIADADAKFGLYAVYEAAGGADALPMAMNHYRRLRS